MSKFLSVRHNDVQGAAEALEGIPRDVLQRLSLLDPHELKRQVVTGDDHAGTISAGVLLRLKDYSGRVLLQAVLRRLHHFAVG